MRGLSVPVYLAGGTIRRARFVKVSTAANHTALEADANERTIGVATDSGREAAIPSVTADPPEAAQSGDPVEIAFSGDIALLEIGSGGCSPGDELKSDADGKGVVAASTGTTIQEIGAVALEDGSDGELVMVQVLYTSKRPALT